MNYWTHSFTPKRDIVIIGAGFTGLHTALMLKQKFPVLKITVCDQLTHGALASTRNAGFACFGSAGEMLDDLKNYGDDGFDEIFLKRWKGVSYLKSLPNIECEMNGGYEVFSTEEEAWQNEVFSHLDKLNKRLFKLTGISDIFQIRSIDSMGMDFLPRAIFTPYEFQINPALLHDQLTSKCAEAGVEVLRNIKIKEIKKTDSNYLLRSEDKRKITTSQVVVCANALASQLLPELDISPARGQIFITQPITGNKIPIGNFHASQGYYYFRNVGNRLLLGGGRQKDIEGETTTDDQPTSEMIDHLKNYASNKILPRVEWVEDERWAGIMAMTSNKRPIIQEIRENLFVACGLSGMGVAISKSVAEEVCGLLEKKLT